MKTNILTSAMIMVVMCAQTISAQVNEGAGATTAVIVSETTRSGCNHVWFEQGIAHTENCRYFFGGPVLGYRFTSYDKDGGGSANTSNVFAGLEIGARAPISKIIALRGSVQALQSISSMEMEGVQYKPFEFNGRLGVESAHTNPSIGAGLELAYLNIRSVSHYEGKNVSIDDYYAGSQYQLGFYVEVNYRFTMFKMKKIVIYEGQKYPGIREVPGELYVNFHYTSGSLDKTIIEKRVNVKNCKVEAGIRLTW